MVDIANELMASIHIIRESLTSTNAYVTYLFNKEVLVDVGSLHHLLAMPCTPTHNSDCTANTPLVTTGRHGVYSSEIVFNKMRMEMDVDKTKSA